MSDTPSRATRSSKRVAEETSSSVQDSVVHEQNNSTGNNNDTSTVDEIPKSLSKEMNMSELNINSSEKGSMDDDDDTELLLPIQQQQQQQVAVKSDKTNDDVIMAVESSKIDDDGINNNMEVDSKPAAKIGDSSEGKVALANKQPPINNNTDIMAVGGEETNNPNDINQNISSSMDIQPPTSDMMAATVNKLTGVTSASTSVTTATAASTVATPKTNSSKEEGEKVAKDFSLTLAIGPTDAQRVYHASKAFNIEMQKLQKVNSQISIGGGVGGEQQTKRKSMDDYNNNNNSKSNNNSKVDKKYLPAVVHSPPSREEPLKPTGTGTAAASTIPMKPPPPILNNPSSLAAAPPPAATTSTPSSSSSLMNDNNNQQQRQQQHTTTTSQQQQQQPQPLRNLLITAAQSTNNTLIKSFLKQMDIRNMSIQEKQTSLLFFLDADKSTKLLAAFDILGTAPNSSGGDEKKKKQGEIEAEEDDGGESKLVQRTGLISLFQSFLTSISSCVHGCDGDASGVGEDDEKKSTSRASTPTVQNTSPAHKKKEGDWKGSKTTLEEILQVATFAADNLIDFAKKEEENNGAASAASFDTFGKWYNSGGFSLVPWLELLDLSKWDYTGHHCENHVPKTTSAYASFPSSSSKRARIQQMNNNEPLTPGMANMNEPIGSPTNFFASGANVGSGFTPSKQLYESGVQSFSAMFGEMADSRTVVSFDFSGSADNSSTKNESSGSSSFHIDITEENLIMLRNLVRRTGFASLTPQYVESLMMKHVRVERHKYGETMYIINRAQFGKFIREIVPRESSKHFDPIEMENYSNYFTNFFTCFDYSWSELKKDEVNAKELMVGFSFLFAGNKSSKLAAAYEMLDVDRLGYLTQRGLMQYLRSYLTMLAGISLLSANKKTTTQIRKRLMSTRRDDAFLAVENGAKWTLSHFLRSFEQEIAKNNSGKQQRNSTRSNAVAFEDFAKWYTEGGYAVAPWLELLDLQKFLSLIGPVGSEPSTANCPPNSHDQKLGEVMFTFPLANSSSLIVLRDDAHYVKSVVNELGLLSLTSEDIWSVLYKDMSRSTAEGGMVKAGMKKSMRMEVDQMTFVNCMMRILNGTGKMKQNSSWSDFSPEETLKNFYLSFDLAESKRVPLNQLMCGLTLLCGGKKSNKLVFAFSLFGGDDTSKSSKKKAFLTENDFFFFFRSFLIVMFSCCNQSLSLSADTVTQYISDTAKSVANDVVTYWKAKKVDKVKFENFSEWYNEGGFETAPWLELLDLNKWVLADQVQQAQPQTSAAQPAQKSSQEQQTIPPTPAAAKNPAESEGYHGLTPGHESIKALLATPKVKANGSSPNNPDCPPAPDDDPLFDLDMSAVDAEVDDMVSCILN